MSRPSNRRQLEVAGEDAPRSQPEPSGSVLARNFGLVDHGRSRWWPAGHAFDPVADRDLIARLHRMGAPFT
jgi:hypothetical protein